MSRDDTTNGQFDEAVERLIRRFRGRIDPGEAAARLVAAAESLNHAPDHAGVSFDALTGTLHVVFDDPDKLEQRLSEFVDLRALVVDADQLPLHQDVVVRISGQGRAIELMGRVVQELPNGKCVQIDRLDSVTETRLRALPKQMRHHPGPDTGPFTRPHTGARIPMSTPTPPLSSMGSSMGSSIAASAARVDPLAEAGFVRKPTLAQHRPSIKPSRTWDLAATPLAKVLLTLVANNATGLIELTGDPRRLILMDRGAFVDVGSDPESPDESLEALLLRTQTIDAADARRASDYRQRLGVGSSEALLNLGICDWNELQVGLRTRIRFLLSDVWGVTTEARFFPLEELPSKPLAKPVRILTAVFGHRAQAIEAGGEVADDIDGYLLKPPETLPPVLATVALLPQHEDILSIRFGFGKGLSEIVRLARSERGEAIAAVETLVQLGFLEKCQLRPISRVQTHSVRQIDILHARLASTSHFEIFGLHWSAYDDEIDKRYKELKAKFAPDQFEEALDDALEKRLEEVRERVEQAWEVLRSRRLRAAHRGELVDDFQVENSVSMFEAQADTAIFRREISEAVGFLSRVLELEPNRHDVKAKLTRLRALT